MNNLSQLSVILPTYKEANNIPVIVKRIDEAMRRQSINYEIIIVDDDSRDGTIEIVETLKKMYNVILKVRINTRGLSSAVIEGFNMSRSDIILVMDADLSHPPEIIPELIKPIFSNKADFVIGSRFVNGGSADHFNYYRKLNAWVSKLLARPLTKVSDPMSGFFAFQKKILIPDVKLNPIGFKIGLEVIVKAAPSKIFEVPIEFQKRLFGDSKLSMKEQTDYIKHLLRLFDHKYKSFVQFIVFSLIGCLGMIVDLSTVYVFKEIVACPFRLARATGFIFAVTTNFFLNRKFTFRSSEKRIARQYSHFLIICLTGFLVNWFISVYLYETLEYFNEHYLIAAFVGIVGGLFINFFGSKVLVFK